MPLLGTRLYCEIGATLLAITAIVWLWMHHNEVQQNLGAAECVQSTQAAAIEQTTATNATNVESADVLSKAVSSYDEKIRALNADRDALALRLRDSARAASNSSPVPNLAGTPGFVCSAVDPAGLTASDRRAAENLSACAANTIELIELRKAWTALHEAAEKNKGASLRP